VLSSALVELVSLGRRPGPAHLNRRHNSSWSWVWADSSQTWA